jgi:hypothetical protein
MYSLVSHLNIFPIGSNVNLSCGGGHLGFLFGIKNLNFVQDLAVIIPGKFGFREYVF